MRYVEVSGVAKRDENGFSIARNGSCMSFRCRAAGGMHRGAKLGEMHGGTKVELSVA